MGDFSRDPGARLQDSVAKHYVGVRLQQGVPILDADWNELEDLRRHEQASLFQRFFGDGVPDGNDGFRVGGLAGGGVGTVVLQAASVPLAGVSSLEIDFPLSTAASLLGFLPAMGSTRRPAANPARLAGNQAEPFALQDGLTLAVRTNGEAPEVVTFAAADFAAIGAATAAEVVAALGAGLGRAVALAGTGNDFVVHGGDGTLAGAGRLLVEGVEAVSEGDLAYASQPLHENPELAAAWGVPVVPALATPAAARRDLVYLDVWDREVGAGEDDAMVLPAVGVEATVRLRREWAVRVAEGEESLDAVVRLPGHRYAALARLDRGAGQAAVPAAAVTDLRVRALNVARYLKTPIHFARGAQLLDAEGYAGILDMLREVLLLRLSSRAFPFTYADAYDEAVVLGAVRDVAQQAAFAAIQARTGNFNNGDGFGFLRTLHGLQSALADTVAALGNGGGSAQAFVTGYRARLDGAAGITGLGPALDTGDLLAAAGAQEVVNAWLSAPVDVLPEGDVVVTIVSVLPASNLAVNVPFNVTYRIEGQLSSPQAQETIDLAVVTAAPSTWNFSLSRSSVTVGSMGGQDTAVLTVTPRAGTVSTVFRLTATVRRNPAVSRVQESQPFVIGQPPTAETFVQWAAPALDAQGRLAVTLANLADNTVLFQVELVNGSQTAARTYRLAHFVAPPAGQEGQWGPVQAAPAVSEITVPADDSDTATLSFTGPGAPPVGSQGTLTVQATIVAENGVPVGGGASRTLAVPFIVTA